LSAPLPLYLNILFYFYPAECRIKRIKKIIDRLGDRFETRCFTETERINASGINRIQYFAGRFAAKEAVLKALGTGWSQGISWTDIEIERLPTGKPLETVRK